MATDCNFPDYPFPVKIYLIIVKGDPQHRTAQSQPKFQTSSVHSVTQQEINMRLDATYSAKTVGLRFMLQAIVHHIQKTQLRVLLNQGTPKKE